ncbi:MAG: hypothetical protein MZW92_64615 [Comamonadaceae bacterium]|nr:hypothetical protein [Comamonadaceae bacterium]
MFAYQKAKHRDAGETRRGDLLAASEAGAGTAARTESISPSCRRADRSPVPMRLAQAGLAPAVMLTLQNGRGDRKGTAACGGAVRRLAGAGRHLGEPPALVLEPGHRRSGGKVREQARRAVGGGGPLLGVSTSARASPASAGPRSASRR